MANNSLFAIKREGKTLGVKDVDQLKRLVSLSEITEKDSVYIIAEKRWCAIEELPAWKIASPEAAKIEKMEPKKAEPVPAAAPAKKLTVEEKVQVVQKVAAGFEEEEAAYEKATPTREFVQLFDQFEKENSNKKTEETAEEDYIAFQPKTIHRVKGLPESERRARNSDVMHALRDGQKPPVFSSVSLRVAVLVFILFLAALAYGLFTSKLVDFSGDDDPRANYLEYQAKSDGSLADTKDN